MLTTSLALAATPEEKLAEMKLTLPSVNAPVANYVPFVRRGELVHISGQVSVDASGGTRSTVSQL